MTKVLKLLIYLSIIFFGFTTYVVYEAAYRLGNSAELSAIDAANQAVSYINSYVLSGGLNASLIDVTEESGLYKIHIRIGQNEYNSFVSKDGHLLFEQGIPIAGSDTNNPTSTPVEIPKNDRPDVKIFVMSYCPYGLQAEKMMLPVYDLLKDKVDIGIYFVYYAMHGKQELDENLRQYCIQNEALSQYFEYLKCFVQSGNSSTCLDQGGINLYNLDSCVTATDATYNISGQFNNQSTWLGGNYPLFDVHKDLNSLYSVSGSPTIIINGVKATVNPRSPENFKQVVCSAFNSSPEECSQTLSTEVPSAGFE